MHIPSNFNRARINLDDDIDEMNNEAQSDLVRIALFLPFMSKEDQESFKFTDEWWGEHNKQKDWVIYRNKILKKA